MTTVKQSTASWVGTGITLLATLLWIAIIVGLMGSYGGEGIGHGGDSGLLNYALTGLYTAVGIVILWVLLALLLTIAGLKGSMPRPAMLAAVVLIPASGVAAIYAQNLLAMPPNQPFSLPSSLPWPLSPFLWPLTVPALVPPLVVGFSFWAMTPSLRALTPAPLAGGLVWGTVLVLSLSLFPMTQMRHGAYEQFHALRDKRRADLFAMPANFPLWDWTPFLDIDSGAVISRVRGLARRQSDAEVMLDRGDFPLGYLGFFALDPTPAICDKTRGLIRRRVAGLVPKTPGVTTYSREADQEIEGDSMAMQWLAERGCDVNAERAAAVSVVRSYRESPARSVMLEILARPQRKP
jgi:hypothetical protein